MHFSRSLRSAAPRWRTAITIADAIAIVVDRWCAITAATTSTSGGRRTSRNRRWDGNRRWDNNRRVVRQAPRYRIERRPVYVNRDRFVFHGGFSRVYHRPVIKYRYYDYRVRPQPIFETIETVPGYIWVSGQWMWGGQEWIWNPGHYAVDPNFQYSQYDYDGDGYADPASYDQQYEY